MEDLEARLAALEQAVNELRAQLEASRTRIRTMKHTVQCPSCGGRRLLHFRRVTESTGESLVAMALGQEYGFFSSRKGAPLEAFVCRQCGLLEWHATRLENVRPDGHMVVELASEEPVPRTPPYR